MLGYSAAMHKFAAPLLALGLLLGLPATAAQTPPARANAKPSPPVLIPVPTSAFRAAFEAATRSGLDDIALAAFRGQPLAGWLEYSALRQRFNTLPLERGDQFLQRYANEAVAQPFRHDWLKALAARNEWPTYLRLWDARIDDPALRCLRLQALTSLNRIDPAWISDAQVLWRSSGNSLPVQCDPVFAQLSAQGGLPDALRWERFDLAVDAAQTGVMRSIASGFPAAEAAQTNAYASYIDAPDTDVSTWPKTPRSRKVVSVALAKLAKASPDRAEAMLPDVTATLGLDENDKGRVLYQIALWTVASYLPQSAQRLANVPLSAYDASLHEWQAREALARSDWPAALAAIKRMPEEQRSDSRWLYLAARSNELSGDINSAKPLYAQAALKSDFHGFLAADQLNQPYTLCPWEPLITPTEQLAIAKDPAIIRALQLFALDRKGWAAREWNDALTRFTDTQRHIAVAVAQDNGWFDRGVFGLLNVDGKRYPSEQRLYTLRFPLHHRDSIRREAARNALDPAWVAAEIRAESVFDPNARSAADARGLMQVIPSTGAATAAKLGLPWTGADSLYDADTNITLGTAYLRQLMDRYGGKPYQVIAGYNAGPAPLNRWLSQRPDMDPAIWIETISYKETREYVARVLSFSTLYDWRLNGDAHRLTDRMLGNIDGPRKGFVCPAAPAIKTTAPKPAVKRGRSHRS